MANFFRFQNQARRRMRPGQQIVRVPGQGYRLAPIPGWSQQGPFQGLPEYTPPDRQQIWGQAETSARNIYQPILDQINQRYERERADAVARQQAMAQRAAQVYGAAQAPMKGLYDSAVQQASTLEESVANRLKGVGEGATGDLAARLKQMGAPETGSAANLQQTYSGASGAGFASGMSDVGSLLRRGTEQQAFLQKAPALEESRTQSELAEQLREMFSQYSDDTGEVTANIPQQIQELFGQLYDQEESRTKNKYDDNWAKIKYLDERKQAAQEAIIVARTMGDKRAEAAAKAEAKRIDQEIKMRGQDVTVRGQNQTAATAAANRDAANKRAQAALAAQRKAQGKSGGRSPEQQRLRENQANSAIKGVFINPQTGQPRKSLNLKNKDNNFIVGQINSALRGNGIDPKSPAGVRIRKAWLGRLGIKFGPGGNPAYG